MDKKVSKEELVVVGEKTLAQALEFLSSCKEVEVEKLVEIIISVLGLTSDKKETLIAILNLWKIKNK